MAQTVEAILGAVYLDSKMDVQAVRAVMALLGLGWPV
jgi:ribonuclease-3